MIKSMTGFARSEANDAKGSLTWELRTVNHRYLEISLRLPELFRSLEREIRDVISQHLTRGRVEAMLTFKAHAVSSQLEINQDVAMQLIRVCESINEKQRHAAPLNAMEILRWPGVMNASEENLEGFKSVALSSLQECAQQVSHSRAQEGEKIKQVLSNNLDSMKKEMQAIVQQIPVMLVTLRERLLKRLAEVNISPENDRMEQEILLLVQKTDVQEELERLQMHISEVQKILKTGGNVGRRLDFLMQELNRETNTIGSKSLDAEISKHVVELKVLIEQMREQIQNVE